MCGRYRLSRRKQIVEEYFDGAGQEDWAPRYNVAPTKPVPIIRQNPKEPKRELTLLRWGLVPFWAKDTSAAAGMTNARSETAATKPAFRDALKFRRCLIPADGFYDRKRLGKEKQPSILTTTANGVTSVDHQPTPETTESRIVEFSFAEKKQENVLH
jgi:putative SOS response-associated peptidase YedK